MGRKPIDFTREDRERIVGLYEDGMTVAAIAKRVGYGVGTIHRLLIQEGARMRPFGTPRLEGRNKKILKLHADGMKDAEIAAHLGMTRQRVQQIRERDGK